MTTGERRIRERHPRVGGLLLALGEQPATELSSVLSTAPTEDVADVLKERCGDDVHVLHNRRWPGGRANIDHLAIAPSGIWLIDAKAYRGNVSVERRLHAKPRLVIRGRDRTNLVEALHRQVKTLRSLMATIDPNVEVHGTVCFTEADLPKFRTLSVAGYPLLRPKSLARRLNQPGPLMRERVELLTNQLAARLPSA
jgi:hypothetical protein